MAYQKQLKTDVANLLFTRGLVIFVIMFALIGCVENKVVTTQPIPARMQVVSGADNAVLGLGDEIAVDFSFWPEIGRVQQKIRLDGYISLPYIGRAKAVGLTPEQLTARLKERYRQYLRNPELLVTVLASVSKRVYVGGEVMSPGVLDLTGRMSVLQAIMMSGGYSKISAELSSVVVIRHQGKNRYINTIDIEKAFRGEGEPFYLAAQDIVYVPRTRIDALNQWVNQYLSKIIAVTGFGVSLYPSDDYNIFIGGQ
ncbi:MAG: polysaccharide export protein [Desulfobulbaceae bacterium]|nr:polysaccharide export protein [Desulfobulbaceae bacterium]